MSDSTPSLPPDCSASPSSSSTPSFLLITASHDLIDPTLLDDAKSVPNTNNKPQLRKWNIYNRITSTCTSSSTSIHLVHPTSHCTDLSPASSVHSLPFLTFLHTAFTQWDSIPVDDRDAFFSEEGHKASGDFSLFVPAQIAPRDAFQRPGSSVYGQLSYYGTDRITPITSSTSFTLRGDLACVLLAVDLINHPYQYIYCLTTHPGHHAGKESFGGYCYLNWAGIVSQSILNTHKEIHKVGVLDVDYHAGFTYSLFYESASVFCISLHADPSLEYPYNYGWEDQRGSGEGMGYTLNVPLKSKIIWAEYKAQLQDAIAKLIAAGVGILVVSLGCDTVENDPETSPVTQMKLTVDDYIEMGDMIRGIGLPVIYIQEGGYKLDVVGDIARNIVRPDVGGDLLKKRKAMEDKG